MKWILKEGGCSGDAVAKEDAVGKAGIFAMIAKISLGLRKFRNHSENFAILAKIFLCENFTTVAKFHYLAKFTVPSENTQFRYLTQISLA